MKKEFDMKEVIFDIDGYEEFINFTYGDKQYIRILTLIPYVILAVGAKISIYIKYYKILPFYLLGFGLHLSLDIVNFPSIYMRIKEIQFKILGIDRNIKVIVEDEYIDILGYKKAIRLVTSMANFPSNGYIFKRAKKIETKDYIFYKTHKRGFFIFLPKEKI